jgi:SAM-dependent methyltransferase
MSVNRFVTWEEAVAWLVKQPDKQELVKACYYDPPLIQAAERYWNSDEWQAIQRWMPNIKGKALDVGAGNGIASYAMAKDGWETFAVEPNPSDTVGAGAIRKLAKEAGLNISVVRDAGEKLPFPKNCFDVIHARQVLHHAKALGKFCHELARVLRPGGILVATREPVISSPKQLAKFLRRHPLHWLYGSENAFRLNQYKRALTDSGLTLVKTYWPFESVVNYAPFNLNTLKGELTQLLNKYPGGGFAANILLHDVLLNTSLLILSLIDRRPGRLFSFVLKKAKRKS